MANPLRTSDINQLTNQLIHYLRIEINQPSLEYSTKLTPLEKGWGGSLYTFKLKNPPTEYSNQLLLRFSTTIQKEATAQQALYKENYPVPKVHFTSTDTTIMNQPFLIRDFLSGDELWREKNTQKKAQILAENHVKLHNINAKPLIKKLEKISANRVFLELNP